MRKPRIGMPLCLDDRGRWRSGRVYHYIDSAYARAIQKAGGVPVYLPVQAEAASEAVSEIDAIDGLLLPGGDDLPPSPGEVPPPPGCLDLTPESQLAFDTVLAQTAIEREIPLLGICYGMQLIARLRGAVLHVHLPSERPEVLEHRSNDETQRHPVEIARESRLAAILGSTNASVNSLHHQAVRQLGSAHRASAHAPDGVIEALEPNDPHAPFEIGVQWHPEKLDSPESERLFGAFVDACRLTEK